MTTIEQLPQKIDSNVVIEPPAKIEIKYVVNVGWYIQINGVDVKEIPNVRQRPEGSDWAMHMPPTATRYFRDAAEPMQYLIERHLIVTKAYKELDKAVKKVAKSKSN